MNDVHASPGTSHLRMPPAMGVLRLLIPVKSADDATRAVAYAIRRRAEWREVTVCLLHVQQAPTQWEVLLGGSEAHAARRRHSDAAFADALRMLDGLDIDCAAYIRSGPVVFSILDAAEELNCDEIVVPAPVRGLLRLLSRDIVATLRARSLAVPVVTVTKQGVAVVAA